MTLGVSKDEYVCRQKCKLFLFTTKYGQSPYSIPGVKRCSRCGKFLKVPEDLLKCPCCNITLRGLPRSRKAKLRLKIEHHRY